MTITELKSLLQSDLAQFGDKRPSIIDRFLHNEAWYIYEYIRHLRMVEYHSSLRNWHKLAFLYHWYKYKHLGFKLHMTIYPNTCKGGLRIFHVGGFTHIGKQCKIGRNCIIVSGVIFGNKSQMCKNAPIIVGDNCYFGANAKIFGPVKIGNNVTIGANAIVTKDVPDGATVVGANKIIMR